MVVVVSANSGVDLPQLQVNVDELLVWRDFYREDFIGHRDAAGN